MNPNPHTPSQDPLSTTALPQPHIETTTGAAFAFFETGTEGLLWAVQNPSRPGYDGLVLIEPGDIVTIKNAQGEVLFEGTINPDRATGAIPRYEGDQFKQPTALGYWIHWTQQGWTPDAWAELFLCESNTATVIRDLPPKVA